MTAIIFANCAVLDGTRPERREDHHVLVEGAHIREVSDRPLRMEGAETVDLDGRTLMPGLIDAHVHVMAVDLAIARLTDRPMTLLVPQAAKVLKAMLARGFTSVRDAGGAEEAGYKGRIACYSCNPGAPDRRMSRGTNGSFHQLHGYQATARAPRLASDSGVPTRSSPRPLLRRVRGHHGCWPIKAGTDK
jgi:Amidohydrolase family